MAALAVAAATLGVLGLPAVAAWLGRTLGTVAAPRRRWRPRLPFLEPAWRALEGWLGLELAADRLVVGPTVALARALAAFRLARRPRPASSTSTTPSW